MVRQQARAPTINGLTRWRSPSGSCSLRRQTNTRLPTFSETADLAGISRVLGGYHIQADNVEGLRLGRKVAEHSWPIVQRYLDGTAEIER